MPSAIFDFADIRSRMLGDDKPKPASKVVTCGYCAGTGWVYSMVPMNWGYSLCSACGNPEAKPLPIDDGICVKCVTWEFLPQIHPGVATNRDGRLMVTDGKQTLILPSPATFIWEHAQARAAIREISRNQVSC